jgi:UMF1 family MFS transporter
MTKAAISRREMLAWAMYDFANSGYTTVVLTVLFNAYFVGVIAASATGSATAWWTLTIAMSNALVILSAPIVGAIADQYACKKGLLVISTIGCVIGTSLLALPGANDLWLAIVLVIFSNIFFGTGENLIAAFIPELAPVERSGRLSGFGWAIGYAGGLFVLLLCLIYVRHNEATGGSIDTAVHDSMLITAACFLLAALPTLLWLRERATPQGDTDIHWLHNGFIRLRATLKRLPELPDLRRFMFALVIFNSGIYTVIILAGVYADQVLGYSQTEIIKLVIVVNISAAIGAFAFGHLQDRIGAIQTLTIILLIWIIAICMLLFTKGGIVFDLAANLIGIALGAAQAVGRALVASFTPPARQAEFFGLWGLAVKLSAIIGPASYAFMITLGGGHIPALATTLGFFVVGLLLLRGIDVQRGHEKAMEIY